MVRCHRFVSIRQVGMGNFVESLLLGFVLYGLLVCAATVAIGVLVWRAAHRSPIGRSTVPALLIAALAAVQWYVVVRVSPVADARALLDWFDPVLRVGLLAVVLYPVVWAGRTLIGGARRRQPIEWRNLIMAVLLVAPAIVVSIRVIAVELTVARIRATASPDAFSSLAAVCPNEPMVCEGVPEFMGGPGVHGLLAWMAIDSLVPPEVVYTLARSSDPIVDLAALRNPRLPVAAYRDRALAVTPDQRRAMMHNPRIPTNVLDSLVAAAPDLGGLLAFDFHYMCERAAPSTLALLAGDRVPAARAAVARSPRVPDALLTVLAADRDSSVRTAADRAMHDRATVDSSQRASTRGCVKKPNYTPWLPAMPDDPYSEN
jgi:hypothetical protein